MYVIDLEKQKELHLWDSGLDPETEWAHYRKIEEV